MKTSIKKLIITLLAASFVCTVGGCTSGSTNVTESTVESTSSDSSESSNTETVNSDEAGIDDFDYDLSEDESSYSIRNGYDGEIVNVMEGEGASVYNIPSEYNGLPVTEVSFDAFRMHNNVKEVIIPDSVVEVGSSAFALCENLEKIEFGKNVAVIGTDVCLSNTSLAELVLDCKVTEIPTAAFAGCESLKTVTLGDSVTTIGQSAFQLCFSLEEFHVTESLTSIYDDDSVFSGCENLTIYAPAGSYAETYAKEKGINFVAE